MTNEVKQEKSLKQQILDSKYIWVLIALYILVGLAQQSVFAQTNWSETETVFYPQLDWGDIGVSLVADQFGFAHLAWSHRHDEGSEPAAIYYSRWDGTNWIEPVDLFITGGWPVLVPDDYGKLYVFWHTGAYLYYSWAWSIEAESVWGWSQPTLILTCAEGCSSPIDVKHDREGGLHLVYTHREGDVYYIYSADEGLTWSSPQPVSNVLAGMSTFLPRLAVADDGRIHATWAEVQLPDGEYLRSNYAHSIDGGLTWSEPFELGAGNHADGNILAVGDKEVHLVWNGGVGVGGRYYIYSNDGGVTWSAPDRISSQSGRAGYPSIVQDSLGELHILIAQGEYVTRRAGQWTEPQRLPFFDSSVEQARLTIVNGNQLLAVAPLFLKGIHYNIKTLDVPAIPSLPYPEIPTTSVPALPATPVYSATISQEATVESVYFPQQEPPANEQSAYSTLILALSTALLVILLGLVVPYVWRKQFKHL